MEYPTVCKLHNQNNIHYGSYSHIITFDVLNKHHLSF